MAIIDKPTDYFNTKLFVGNSSTNAITGVGHQPDWTWIKRRDGGNGYSNFVFDAVRGVNKGISTNLTAAEITFNNGFNSFNSDGFTLGANTSNPSATEINASGGNYASWNWKAGTSFTNDASGTGIGTIDSAGSVNTDAGFSIITFTGTGNAGSVAHGLGAIPKFLVVKSRSNVNGWIVYHVSLGAGKGISLNLVDAAFSTGSRWNSTEPTSTVFSLGTAADVNRSGGTHVCYAFAEKQGYSKFGSYLGNGNSNGPYVYLGFKPAFLMIKDVTGTGEWLVWDNKRSPSNEMTRALAANDSLVEDTTKEMDFLSNGFKIRTTDTNYNASGNTNIFMAFAEEPFVASNYNVATAR